MVRTILMAAVALASVSVGPRHAEASEAPWCAVINLGTGSVYWDCQYRSFEECYSKGNTLAGNRGVCNPSPYYRTVMLRRGIMLLAIGSLALCVATSAGAQTNLGKNKTGAELFGRAAII
jgi:Protein of unknown function (DUF3551)